MLKPWVSYLEALISTMRP